jgi:cellulase/cellobiase CelA1
VKIHRSTGYIHIDLSGAEAAWLLEELETVRGGAKFPKIRQVCEELKTALALGAQEPDRKRGRPKSAGLVELTIPNRVAQMALDPNAIAQNAEGLRRACEENED